MSTRFLLIAVLSYLSGAEGFKFYVTRNLRSTQQLGKDVWSSVEVLGTESENPVVEVKFSIPLALSYSDVFVFFANDTKEILGLHLNDFVTGNFYEMPHKRTKSMRAGETKTVVKDGFREITGEFPGSWLPEGFNRVSAAIRTTDGNYYNYYGIQNAEISIPDLFVVEEFKKL